MKKFKISDPLTDVEHMGDRLHKVKEMFKLFNSACKANFWPKREVALDEAIKKFKGRCISKQYIKNKPVKWGIKIYCVCCSYTSYLFNSELYIGKREEEIERAEDAPILANTLTRLLLPLQGLYHRVYMDNFYTSVPLFNALAHMDIWATGTVKSNRKCLSSMVTFKKAEEAKLKKMPPGQQRYSSAGVP
jgi:hypothetical protein